MEETRAGKAYDISAFGRQMSDVMGRSQDDYMARLMAHLDHTDELAVPHKLVAGCSFCADYAEERKPLRGRLRAWLSARVPRPCRE